MRNNKKYGFTLIELLATIVILAVIALITVPIITGIKVKVEKRAFKQSAEGILKITDLDRNDNGRLFFDKYNIKDFVIKRNGATENVDVDNDGQITGEGYVAYTNDGLSTINYSNKRWCATKSFDEKDIRVIEGACTREVDYLKCEVPVISVKPDNTNWTQQKKVTISKDPNKYCRTYYSIDGGKDIEYTGAIKVDKNNTIIEAKSVNVGDEEEKTSETIIRIDRTAPESVTFTFEKTTRSITITASGTDAESEISKYAFSKDNGATWEAWQDSNVYTFDGLTSGTYSIKVKAYNGTYGTPDTTESIGATESDTKEVTLLTCSTPTIAGLSGWAQQKTITINYGEAVSGCSSSYSIDGGSTWETGTSEIITVNDTNVIAKNTDGVNTVTSSVYKVTQIDRTAPSSVTFTTTRTTRSITATASATDNESGISKYAFSSDGGSNWTEWQDSNVYIFDGLTSGTYSIKVKAYNETYGSDGATESLGAKESDTKEVTLLTCSTPTIAGPSGWAQQKTVTINYGTAVSGCTSSYSIDGGSTWQTGTSATITVNNTNVIAKNTDGVNTVTSSVYKVTQIDRTAPSSVTLKATKTTKSITVTASATDPESEIAKYAFSSDGGSNWTSYQTSNVYTFNNLRSGIYSIKVKAYNGTYGSDGATESLGAKVSAASSVTLLTCSTPTIAGPGGWAQQKTVTMNYGTAVSGCSSSYSIDGGSTWKTGTSATITVNNTSVIAKNTDGVNTVSSSVYKVTGIDRTVPTAASAKKGTVTSKSIQVTASGTDNESKISRYAFSKDNGSTWTSYQTSNVYTFNNLKTGTYKIKVKVYNGTYGSTGAKENLGTRVSAVASIATTAIGTPSYSISSTGWATSKTVTITYPSGYTNEYSVDGGKTWKSYTKAISFTKNGSVIARVRDGVNTVTASTYSVTKIDNTTPTATITIKDSSGNSVSSGSLVKADGTYTVTIGCTAGVSGIKGYSYLVLSEGIKIYSGSSSSFNMQPSERYITSGTLNISASCTNNASTSSANATANLSVTLCPDYVMERCGSFTDKAYCMKNYAESQASAAGEDAQDRCMREHIQYCNIAYDDAYDRTYDKIKTEAAYCGIDIDTASGGSGGSGGSCIAFCTTSCSSSCTSTSGGSCTACCTNSAGRTACSTLSHWSARDCSGGSCTCSFSTTLYP